MWSLGGCGFRGLRAWAVAGDWHMHACMLAGLLAPADTPGTPHCHGPPPLLTHHAKTLAAPDDCEKYQLPTNTVLLKPQRPLLAHVRLCSRPPVCAQSCARTPHTPCRTHRLNLLALVLQLHALHFALRLDGRQLARASHCSLTSKAVGLRARGACPICACTRLCTCARVCIIK